MTAVTVALPVKDGASHLRELLPALAAQEVPGGIEILAVDSGSRDGSAALLEAAGVRLVRISAREFNHGETRNRAAREASGRVVVFLTQDALPADGRLVARLVAPLDADPRIAGAFARQVPRPDADPLTRREIASSVTAAPEPRTVFLEDREAFARLPPLERYRLAAFDNVASAVRRDLLLRHPFPASRFGEDLEWALGMLERGHGLVYVPEAVVIHSHAREARALYRRNYLGHRLLQRLFGFRSIPGRLHLVRACLGTAVGDLSTLAREGSGLVAFVSAPAQAVASVYGQYRGARDEALARPYPGWA